MTFCTLPYMAFGTAAPVVDPYASYVRSLMHFDGSGTALVDVYSGNTWVSSGTATQSTSSPIYGSASLLVDSSADSSARTSNAPANFNFGTEDFTVEIALKLDVSQPSSFPVLIEAYNGSAGGAYDDGKVVWQLYFNNNAAGSYDFYWWTPIGVTVNSSFVTSPLWDGNVHYVAYSRASGTGYLYIDGEQVGSGSDTINYTGGTRLTVGRSDGDSNQVVGLIDELRITKGIGRYSDSSYTVQTTAFPDAGVVYVPPGPITTGWVSPGTVADSGSTWTNPNNIKVTDGSETVGAVTGWLLAGSTLRLSNFNFALPSSAVVSKVEYEFVGWITASAGITADYGTDLFLQKDVTAAGGNNMPAVRNFANATSATYVLEVPQTATFNDGSTVSSVTAAQFNASSFGVQVSTGSTTSNPFSGGTVTIRIDSLRVRLTYTA
ncbi:LamG-like jellyroll fold domain-containing protein [Variovorax sp. AB1(2024)]|uniref:LamG-like jellyroll fold domain-containing protein n=1 Tax=Variovorax sp. AB1(2024) TaxID=3132214 RepID=UPI00309CACD9